MPYRWTEESTETGQPAWHLTLWPHRSLPPEGFAVFVGITFILLLVPLFAVLGSPILWGLLPFAMGTLALTWILLRRNYADAALQEDLSLARDEIALVRHNPRGPDQSWQANPYWVRVELHADGGPVENYITLAGAGRQVEIGAFLSPDERKLLYSDLTHRLARIDLRPGTG